MAKVVLSWPDWINERPAGSVAQWHQLRDGTRPPVLRVRGAGSATRRRCHRRRGPAAGRLRTAGPACRSAAAESPAAEPGLQVARHRVAMSRPPRVEGFNYLGPYRYFVTFCTFDRRDLLSDVVTAQFCPIAIPAHLTATKFAILAYSPDAGPRSSPPRRKIGAIRLPRINQEPETELGPEVCPLERSSAFGRKATGTECCALMMTRRRSLATSSRIRTRRSGALRCGLSARWL